MTIKLRNRTIDLLTYKSLAFVLIPLVLIIFEGSVRESISDYAYSESRFVRELFVALLVSAGVIFIDTGVLKKQWYDIVLGGCLIVVAFTPHLDYPILHYLAAALFFIGYSFVMLYYSSPAQRPLMIVLSSIVIIPLVLNLVFGLFNTLVAEWIGMFPFVFHKIGEVKNKIV